MTVSSKVLEIEDKTFHAIQPKQKDRHMPYEKLKNIDLLHICSSSGPLAIAIAVTAVT